MSDHDKEKIQKMSRKELNAEVLHCWREQGELMARLAATAKRIAELEAEVETLKKVRATYIGRLETVEAENERFKEAFGRANEMF